MNHWFALGPLALFACRAFSSASSGPVDPDAGSADANTQVSISPKDAGTNVDGGLEVRDGSPTDAASTRDASGDTSADPNYRYRVFLTRTMHAGHMTNPGTPDGVQSADIICEKAAPSPSKRWVAWLSTSTEDAISRLRDGHPWFRVSDPTTMVFAGRSALRAPMNAITNIEGGVSSGYVWTGSGIDGKFATNLSCGDWKGLSGNGIVGKADATSPEWTHLVDSNCGNAAHLYCFEEER
jgi:hypothetical protein